jgi:hypothetical protein
LTKVLTTASTLACSHGGTLQVSPSQHQLTVDDHPALLQTDLLAATVSGCKTPATTSSKPCLKVASMLVGPATKLTVGGTPVVLETAQGLTDGVPQPATWTVQSAGQSKLEGS